MNRQQQSQSPSIPIETIKTIITDHSQTGAKALIEAAETLGKELSRALSTSQIRAIFGEVRSIQATWESGNAQRERALRRLILLKPKMAYRARRERGQGVEQLRKVLDAAIDQVLAASDENEKNNRFQRFVEFFEAILAYHKAYGGN